MRSIIFQAAKFTLYCVTLTSIPSLVVTAQTGSDASIDRGQRGIGSVTTDNIAKVTINGHSNVEIPLQPNGKLASHDLNWIEIGTASVRSVGAGSEDAHITCFFWHEDDGSAPDRRMRSVDKTSTPFTTESGLKQPFANARRVYCYDSSADVTDDDAFVIFVKNEQGREGLVRVRMGDGVSETVNNDIKYEAGKGMGSYGVLNLNDRSDRQLGYDVTRAAVVHAPAAPPQGIGGSMLSLQSEMASRAACMAFSGSKPLYGLWMGNQLTLDPPRDVTRIACFKAETSQQASKSWEVMRKWSHGSRASSAHEAVGASDWW